MHQKLKLSSFIHLHIDPNLSDFFLILQNIFFYVLQKKETHTGLDRFEDLSNINYERIFLFFW